MVGRRKAPKAQKAAGASLVLMIEGKAWEAVPGLKARLNAAAVAVYAHLPVRLRFPFSATLLLTTDAKVRTLNHDYRGKDKATNVLSFPQYDPTDLPKIGKNQPPIEVGDIAIAYQTVAKEAKESNKLTKDHTTHLTIHGLLHLFGYDHMEDEDAEKMEKLETRIMKAMGLPDPYAPPSMDKPAPKRRKP